MAGRLKLINAVIDVATSGASRSLRAFFTRPALSIREGYSTRITVNLVFFARNYLNIVLLCVLLYAYNYPMIYAVLISAAAVHFSRSASISLVAKFCQLFFCVYVPLAYGVLPVLMSVIIPMVLVVSHAVLTPYTNEAMSCFEITMRKKGLEAPAPRSPTREFEHVDPTFATALLLPQAVTGGGDIEGANASSTELPQQQSLTSLKGYHQRTTSQAIMAASTTNNNVAAASGRAEGHSPVNPLKRYASREAEDALMTPRLAQGELRLNGVRNRRPRNRQDDDRDAPSSLPTFHR